MKFTKVIARIILILALLLTLYGCNKSDNKADTLSYNSDDNIDHDIISTKVTIDLTNKRGIATIAIKGSIESSYASFEIGDLLINSVKLNALDLDFNITSERLYVTVPKSSEIMEIVVSYTYLPHDEFNGISSNGYTFAWPYFCGNIFPCHSNPNDGTTFDLTLEGVPDGMRAIYPETISSNVPSYTLGWSLGAYEYYSLGQTDNGTEVGIYYFQDEYQNAINGTLYLKEIFNWYEKTLGHYLYGDKVASVSLPWEMGAYGGMEHQPYWHINSRVLSELSVHAHEAAHGWFGNGVRIACWEDYVLSEGVATYLTVRAIEEVVGISESDKIWADYQSKLNALQSSDENKTSWPEGCNQIDIIESGLYGYAPYMKGAYFLQEVANKIGKIKLDRLLGEFYLKYRNSAAGFQDLLDIIKIESGYDPLPCAISWLRSESLPDREACQ